MQDDNRLDDKARIEIMQVLGEFRDKPKSEWTQEAIEAFCKKEGIERVITPGYLEDYAYQAKMDEILTRIFPEILDIIKANVEWIPLFALQAAHQQGNAGVAKAVEEIVKLLEREGVEYDYAESMIALIGKATETLFGTAQRVTKKRATRVFEGLARKEFGSDLMTMADVAKYSEENFEKETNEYK